MNLIQKCVCILLVAMSHDFYTGWCCSQDDVHVCNIPYDSLTQEQKMDPKEECKVLPTLYDCLKALQGCPSDVQLRIDRALENLETNMRMKDCPERDSESPECTVESVHSECEKSLKELSVSEESDPDVSCPLRLKSIDCMLKKIETCSDAVKGQIQSHINDIGFTQAVCEFHVSETGHDVYVCPAKEIFVCTAELETLKSNSQTDLEMMCPNLLSTFTCLSDGIKSCPDSVKTQFNKLTQPIEQTIRTCKDQTTPNPRSTENPGDQGEPDRPGKPEDGGDDKDIVPECTTVYILYCFEPHKSLTDAQREDPKEVCKILPEEYDCLKSIHGCSASMQEYLDSILESVESRLKNCTETNNESSECTVESVHSECEKSLKELSDSEESDPDVICPLRLESIDCMVEKIDTCSDVVKDQIQNYTNDLGFTQAVCEFHVNDTGHDVYVCPTKEIFVCTAELEALKSSNQTDLDMMCPKLLSTYTCLSDGIKSCPESVKTHFNKLTQPIEQAKIICEDQKTPSPTSTENPGNQGEPDRPGEPEDEGDDKDSGQGCTMEYLQDCSLPYRSLTDAQKEDPKEVCKVIPEQYDCLKVKEGCPEFLEMILSSLESRLKNCTETDSESPECTVESVHSECEKSLKELSDSEESDPDVTCPLRLGSIDCMMEKMDTCSDVVKDQIQNYTKDLGFTQAVCEFHVNDNGHDMHVCPAKQIFVCTAELEALKSRNQTDLEMMCPKILSTYACLSDGIKSCPDSVKTHFNKLTQPIAQTKTICEDQTTSRPSSTDNPGNQGDSGTTEKPDDGGKDTTDSVSSCSQVDLDSCYQQYSSLTPTQRDDPGHMCQVHSKYYDCLKGLHGCSAFLQSVLNTAFVGLEISLQYCSERDSESPECTVESIHSECEKPLKELSVSEEADPDVTCPLRLESIDCMSKKIDTCSDAVKGQIQSHMNDLGFTQAVCEFHVNDTGHDMYVCPPKELFACAVELEALKGKNQADLEMMCPKLLSTYTCLSDGIKSCPESVKTHFNKLTHPIEQAKRICEDQRTPSPTSTENPGNQGDPEQPDDGGDDNGSGASCSLEDVQICHNPQESLTLAQLHDPKKMCQVYSTYYDCLKSLHGCPVVLQYALDLAFSDLEIRLQDCSDQSSCSLEDIQACHNPHESLTLAQRDDPKEMCRVYSSYYDCLKSLHGCPDVLQYALDLAFSDLEIRRQDCSEKDNESHNCTAESVHYECEMSVKELNASEVTDPDVFCPLRLEAMDCMLKEVDTCSDVVKDQIQNYTKDLGFTQAVCEFHVNDTAHDVYVCPAQEIFVCTAELEALKSRNQTDLEMMCPKLLSTYACLSNETKSCPESVKTHFDNLTLPIEQTIRLCEDQIRAENIGKRSDGGESLRYNAGVLLIAVIFVVVQHFQ